MVRCFSSWLKASFPAANLFLHSAPIFQAALRLIQSKGEIRKPAESVTSSSEGFLLQPGTPSISEMFAYSKAVRRWTCHL